jgi:glyoxylase-like metal-dependent hydrolase (beta-lactamase superfamily II)
MSSTADAFLTFYHQGENRDYKIESFICEPANKTFEGQFIFECCGHSIKLTSVYGHSSDGLIVVVDGKLLFSGDTLLSVPTATRFPSGNSKKFWCEDIPMLKGSKNIELVYPGHGKPGCLDEMLEINKMPERYKKL